MMQKWMMEFFDLDARNAKRAMVLAPVIALCMFGLIFIYATLGYIF